MVMLKDVLLINIADLNLTVPTKPVKFMRVYK